MIDRALANGIRVSAWTFDELYGRDGRFLDALEQRRQVFVAEIPVDCVSIGQHGTAGCENRKSCKKGRKTRDVGVGRDIRVWPSATIPAKFAIWPSTHPRFASSHGNDTVSRTPTRARTCGK